MSRSMMFRCSAMMFLEYAIPGAFVPILSLYLAKCLNLSPWQIGIIMAMPSLAANLAPLVATRVADRWLSAERTLALCLAGCAGLMLFLTGVTGFVPFVIGYFLHGFFFSPTSGLTNTVTLHHTNAPRRHFGPIRGMGTLGWVAIAWGFGYFWLRGGSDFTSRLPHALWFSAGIAFLLAVYSLSFPPALQRGERKHIPTRDLLAMFSTPSMIILVVTTLLNSMTHMFYYYGMSQQLHYCGFAKETIMPVMSLGQATEVVCMIFLGPLLKRLGLKRTLILGVLAQSFRYVLFAFIPDGITWRFFFLGIGLHGVAYTFFFTSAYIYVEEQATPYTRSSAQQLLSLLNSGAGNFLGYVSAGFIAQHFLEAGHINFKLFWLPPALLGAVITFLLLFFREEPLKNDTVAP